MARPLAAYAKYNKLMLQMDAMGMAGWADFDVPAFRERCEAYVVSLFVDNGLDAPKGRVLKVLGKLEFESVFQGSYDRVFPTLDPAYDPLITSLPGVDLMWPEIKLYLQLKEKRVRKWRKSELRNQDGGVFRTWSGKPRFNDEGDSPEVVRFGGSVGRKSAGAEGRNVPLGQYVSEDIHQDNQYKNVLLGKDADADATTPAHAGGNDDDFEVDANEKSPADAKRHAIQERAKRMRMRIEAARKAGHKGTSSKKRNNNDSDEEEDTTHQAGSPAAVGV